MHEFGDDITGDFIETLEPHLRSRDSLWSVPAHNSKNTVCAAAGGVLLDFERDTAARAPAADSSRGVVHPTSGGTVCA
jgi:hypothetical protein